MTHFSEDQAREAIGTPNNIIPDGTKMVRGEVWYKGYMVEIVEEEMIKLLYEHLALNEDLHRKHVQHYIDQLDKLVAEPTNELINKNTFLFTKNVCWLTWMDELVDDEFNGVLLMLVQN